MLHFAVALLRDQPELGDDMHLAAEAAHAVLQRRELLREAVPHQPVKLIPGEVVALDGGLARALIWIFELCDLGFTMSELSTASGNMPG